jgi:hypothetical protein
MSQPLSFYQAAGLAAKPRLFPRLRRLGKHRCGLRLGKFKTQKWVKVYLELQNLTFKKINYAGKQKNYKKCKNL